MFDRNFAVFMIILLSLAVIGAITSVVGIIWLTTHLHVFLTQ